MKKRKMKKRQQADKKIKSEIKKAKIRKLELGVKTLKVSTGIHGLDKLINGGFNKESVNLVVGGSGSGKTIFALQFLVEGLKKGEPGLLVTFEEKKEDFYKNMLRLGWDLQKYEKAGKFIFLEYSPEKVKSMLQEGGGAIENIVLKNKIQRLVIDSITSFALLFETEILKRKAALALFNITKKWKCTSLLTIEEDPAKQTKSGSTSLEFEADSIIYLYFVRRKLRRRRYIEVLKMRGTKHSTEIYPFTIGKTGINVSGPVFKDHLV